MDADYLGRYRRGEREAVWRDLLALGELTPGTAAWWTVDAVARETMSRARRNVELLVQRLDEVGYRFEAPRAPSAEPLTRCVFVPPRPDVRQRVDDLEARTGPVPLSLRAWWEEVGTVDLTGSHPDWPTGSPGILNDALVVNPVESVLSAYEEWSEERASEDPEWREEAFDAPLAPDILHKADVSGGLPCAIRLPDGGADALLRNVAMLMPDVRRPDGLGVDVPEPTETLVGYLRRSFRWAGFPGFEALPRRPDDMLARLRRELLPL
jgi:hypothetical protein